MVEVSPIRTEEDYDAALARLSEIFQAEIGTPEGDERDVLADLVECYEDRRYPISPPTDLIASIEFEMDQRGLTRQDLALYIGSLTKVTAILSRQEDITMSMARALHKRLGIDAETLLQEPLASREWED